MPVRTAELIKKILLSSTRNSQSSNSPSFSILSSPEFLAEGTAVKDLESPDRVLIGGEDDNAIEQLSLLYQRWISKEKIFVTNVWSSELSKLTANAFLAQRISSINAISSLCEQTGADVRQVSRAIGADSRIGDKFLVAGPGFGGSCFQKDILNIIYLCRYYGLDQVANYWEQVVSLNKWQKKRISEVIIEKFFGTITAKKLVILGFSFKSNTNDTRESPAITIAKDLMENGANLLIHDPKVTEDQICLLLGSNNKENQNLSEGSWQFTENIELACENADGVILITDWEDYLSINWRKISNLMRKPSWVFDTRGVIDTSKLSGTDVNFWKLGKGIIPLM